VQAILARTFALAHINKHVTEGFSLCDLVHCQAYHGKPRDLNVFRAVEATEGLVVVDHNLDLIVAAFHSNSGGQTANSEDVWGGHTSYLRSIVDTFSRSMPNYSWEKRMPASEWLSYLRDRHNFPTETDSGRNIALNFRQDNRKSHLECSSVKVPLRSVRQDLQLRSTFFSVSRLGSDSVVLSGRGYGHGLGMCQEGAMLMARRGYSYQEILDYYYQNIRLIDLEKLRFFKDE
jgi:stage II sporulation protein D